MKKIKLFDPFIDNQEKEAIVKVLQSKFWASGAGTGNVAKFETQFKNYTKSKACIAVNSGTAALHLALSLFNIKNKEVILPSLSFVTTAHAVIYNGGKPKFVDVEENTLCLDPQKVKEAITDNTGAILPVHFGGMACNLEKLGKISKQENIPIIEDAAHAAGAKYNNKNIGSHSEAVCFSFHPVKNLAMPTGGAITINNLNSNKILELKSKRWCGISDRKDASYDVRFLGWNFYMNEFSAAIGLLQLKKLNESNKLRQKIVKKYLKNLKVKNTMPFDKNCAYHLFWIRVKNRTKIMKELKIKGIETGIHYKPIHKMSYYNRKIKLPITEKIENEIISIPIHPNLTDKDTDYIIKCINKINKN